MSNEIEYDNAMIDFLEMIWGDGFMAPGGAGNVANLIEGLDLQDKHLLDIGCGLGGPACLLAGEYGAQVVGTDLESHLVENATQRAERLGVAARTEFLVVEPGPLQFPNESFDVVLSSGAFTQIANKREMFAECLRVLRPGGTLTCYDWMKPEGEYSEDMLHWFKMEGLTYAMQTPDYHREALEAVGFADVELRDRSDWYRQKAREEYEVIQSELYPQMVERIGRKDADHFLENWRAMVVVNDKGEILQVYSRARKPD
jgi:phosphoethanolamine N-methyltransferase